MKEDRENVWPCSSALGISQARILAQVAFPPPGDSSRPRDQNLHLLHLLHWQADSLPLTPPAKPQNVWT